MKSTRMRVIVASILVALAPASFADEGGGERPGMHVDGGKPAGRIAAEFAALAGSKQNALALVNGLRNGTAVTLANPASTAPETTGTTPAATTPTTTTATTTTITPATGKMGWGNVRIALALAEHTLAANGITKPTPAQLDAALNGGDITVKSGTGPTATTKTVTLNGVLTERASGMGWGQVAKAEGTTVGTALHEARAAAAQKPAHIVAEHQGGKPAVATVKPVTPATSGTPATKGVTTAAVASPSRSGAGRGIVTAAGGATNAAAATHGAKAPATAGVVTATGSAASAVTTAQGSGGGKTDDKGGKGHKG